ncbi:trypsin-like peptidase domain-containing protein [Candidatus Falkowbacteria bacterium]|nr:trypsin-like peptidase domain-containing protein [Candidatus Falkowbacteria bacterium]
MRILRIIIITIIIFSAGVGGTFIGATLIKNTRPTTAVDLQLDEQEATIRAINKVMPAVVSIMIYDQNESVLINLGEGTQEIKKEKVQKGSGTGFLISSDGLILTNKHVVNVAKEETAEYKVILNSGKQYYAQLIGKDPINDLAVLKIFDKNLSYVELGDSDKLEIGTTVIAIGNTLGRYQNSATKGIVSGLGRSIAASDQSGNAEALDNVIQTDAEINLGNSGGPLINLEGKVVGVNVAIDEAGSSIGFAILINDAKPVIRTVRQTGRIVRPRLGVRYIMLTPEIAEEKGLKRTGGAWIAAGANGEAAVLSDSPAQKGGLAAGDIIFEINGVKLEEKNTLLSVVQRYKPGDKIGLKIQRGDKIIIRTVQLDEFK